VNSTALFTQWIPQRTAEAQSEAELLSKFHVAHSFCILKFTAVFELHDSEAASFYIGSLVKYHNALRLAFLGRLFTPTLTTLYETNSQYFCF